MTPKEQLRLVETVLEALQDATDGSTDTGPQVAMPEHDNWNKLRIIREGSTDDSGGRTDQRK